MRIKPGTELHRVYSTLASEYDTDSDLLKDGLWALIEKKYPEKMDVKMIEKKVLIKE